MPLYAIDGTQPSFADADTNWIAPDATLIGDVRVGRNAGFWFGVVIRGDNEPITIGADTNVQEHTVMAKPSCSVRVTTPSMRPIWSI